MKAADYRSGFCQAGNCQHCRGHGGGVPCSHTCHRAPEPEPAPLPSLLHDGSESCPMCGRPWEPLSAAVGGASAQW